MDFIFWGRPEKNSCQHEAQRQVGTIKSFEAVDELSRF